MFNYTTNAQSVATASGDLQVNISALDEFRIDTVGFSGLDADSVNVRVTSSSGDIYNVTEVLYSRAITNWYDYFYKAFKFRKSALFSDIPVTLTNFYFITISAASRQPKCAALVVGQKVYLGQTQYDPTISTINYSTITADLFGNTTLIARRSVPNNTVTTQLPAINVDDALEVKDQLNAVAALWSGLDDDTQPYFGSLLLFGVYTQFDIDPFSVDYATVTLQLQGL
jgi:hypothetical protein